MNIPHQPLGFRQSFPLALSLPTLNFPEKKSAALCALALETIMTLNPKDMWLRIYTDGSAQDDGSAGMGFYCENLFEGSLTASLGAINFDAEIEAVRQTISHLNNLSTSYRQAVFLVYSQSAFLTLYSLRNSDFIEMEEVRENIYELNGVDWTIIFQWIPSHCSIPGSEKADSLGPLAVSPVTGRMEPTYPAWKRNLFRYCVSLPVIAFCLLVVFLVMFLIFELQTWWDRMIDARGYPFWMMFFPKVLLALVINVLDGVYHKIAVWLNDKGKKSFPFP
ncbi:anoctamin [Trichonephila clavipes]|nr:anoctamin [Trichonephila clavipes]